MPFSHAEREALLKLKGVGDTVINRFEEIGVESFDQLSNESPEGIADLVASMLRTTCWKNSPQARAAIEMKKLITVLLVAGLAGQSPLLQAETRELVEFPPMMQNYGTQMHRAASRSALQSRSGDVLEAYQALPELTAQCVACHSAYRIR